MNVSTLIGRGLVACGAACLLSSCAVVAVGATVVGAAVSVTTTVVSTGVKATTAVVGAAVDAVSGDEAASAPR
ncbi:hypothetical protein C7444_107172 [Sphaerotilus hippei]|uniref:Lipoprotein n=1 Tax=Sphaerotilus hippei TaxID=744406 RepID=A0A318H4W9_9BURK|nr:hypothetical protein [Sphaerotilus hippei]PXW96266.1 hypothetical protein C7444_107172 [Sphaerotilus hippei]